jgi:hypothetical protein
VCYKAHAWGRSGHWWGHVTFSGAGVGMRWNPLMQALTAREAPGGMLAEAALEAGLLSNNAATRRAGGRLVAKPAPTRIVVDMREFMSSLPAVLHQQGFEIVPVTLEVMWQTDSELA